MWACAVLALAPREHRTVEVDADRARVKMLANRLSDRRRVAGILQHRLGLRKARILQQKRQSRAFQRDVVIAGHPIKAMHLPALIQHQPRQMKADETRCASDKDGHGNRENRDGVVRNPA